MAKLDLMKQSYAKLSHDQDYLAFSFEFFCLAKQYSSTDLINYFGCSEEDFYKLALCKTPKPGERDYADRVARIAAYASVKEKALMAVVEMAYNIDQRPYLELPWPNILVSVQANVDRILKSLRNVIFTALPGRMRIAFFRLGQLSVSASIIVFFLLNFTTVGHTQNLRNFYQREHPAYTDSIRGLCQNDDTHVSLNAQPLP